MRNTAVLSFLVVLALALGACGSEDSGEGGIDSEGVPDSFRDTAPSSNVPALVDTTGMTEAQLEAKVEEIEKLIDANMEEMRELSAGMQPGSMDPEKSKKLMQVTADGNALRSQLMKYDEAIDALDE